MTDGIQTEIRVDEDHVAIEAVLDGVDCEIVFLNDGQDRSAAVMFLAGVFPQLVAAALTQLEEAQDG